jgi:hypothetical protein
VAAGPRGDVVAHLTGVQDLAAEVRMAFMRD